MRSDQFVKGFFFNFLMYFYILIQYFVAYFFIIWLLFLK